MSNQLKRKLKIMFAIELIFILALGSFLLSMQSSLSIDNQKVSNVKVLEQIEELVMNREELIANTYESFDEVYKSKALSVAYMAKKTKDFETTNAKMKQLRSLLQVDNVIILDNAGKMVASADPTKIDFSVSRYNQLRNVFAKNEASEGFDVTVEDETMRYYGAKISDTLMVVIVQNPTELYEALNNTTSIGSTFSGVTVGLEGYAFAVSHKDYSILAHPNEDLVGADALSAGIDAAQLQDGYSGWITLNGEELYCSSKTIGDIYALCATPKSEINAARFATVFVTLLTFFIVANLVIAYAVFLKEEEQLSSKDSLKSYKKLGNFYINTKIGSKVGIVGIFGLVVILIVSMFMQTLFSLSRQTMSNMQALTKIEQTIEKNNDEIDVLTKQYNERYLNKCQVLAEIVKNNPELINDNDLAELSNILGVINIWIYDAQGKTIATDSTYWDFVLSTKEEEQSYAFRNIINGYQDYIIQDPLPEEISGELRQYIGVTMRTGDEKRAGFAQICIAPEKLDNVLANTSLNSLLSGIKIGSDGYAFAVKKEDQTFSYYPEERYIGKPVMDYGMTEFALHDDFTDFIKINSGKYYASSKEMGENLIYVVIPEAEMNRFCIPVAFATGGSSLLCLLIMGLVLITSRKIPSKFTKTNNEDSEDNEDIVDVKMPDGRTAKTVAAASRWGFGAKLGWDNKTSEQKLLSLLNILIGATALLLLIVIVFKDQFFSKDSIMHYVFSERWEKNLNIFAFTNAIILFVIANLLAVVIRRLLMVFARIFGARGETVCRLLDNVIKYMTILCILYYCLGMFGVDTKTLLASAGIMSVIIGLGSQALISDILAGLFIVFEGEFRVGDIVTIGDWRGTVLEIGVRTTKIQDPSDNIKIISNSSVSGVINMTKQHSYAFADVGIEYGESLERVEHILKDELPLVKKRVPSIIDGPFYKGVVELGNNSVNIRLVAQCAESDRIQLSRDLNREIKLIFDKNNISIPFPQVVINKPVVFEKVTLQDKIQSAVFVEEQKEISRGMEDVEEQ